MKRLSLFDAFSLLVIGVLCYLLIFQHLGDYSLRMWDEARNGVNALEMLRTNNYLVTYFKGHPEMWNTKPPLLIWLIIASFKLFGVSDLTLRIPSAIAASLVVFITYLFSSVYLKSKWTGLLGSLILFTSFGFFDNHIARTGDYDALLVLFVFIASIFTFIFVNSWENKHLYLAGAFWILAVYTKGIAGLLITPGILAYLLITKKLSPLAGSKKFWITLTIFAFIVLAYYVGRNILNPGYLSAVWTEELFGRATNNNEADTNIFLYYWKWLSEFRFQHWIYLLPFSFIGYFLTRRKIQKQWIIYSYLIVLSYYLVISLARGKNIWYDAQLYPYASILVASFIVAVIRKVPLPIKILFIAILSFYLQRYIRTNLAFIQRPDLEMTNSCLKYGYYFRNNDVNIEGLVAIHLDSDHCMPFVFYMQNEGLQTKHLDQIVQPDRVFTCDDETSEALNKNFNTEVMLDNEDGCVVVEIRE